MSAATGRAAADAGLRFAGRSAALDAWTLGWLFAGGVAYTLGTFFYHRRAPGYAHAIWHLFVIAGGACHFVAIAAQVLPRG